MKKMLPRFFRAVIVSVGLLAWRAAGPAERPLLDGPSVSSVEGIDVRAFVAPGSHHGTWERTGRDNGGHTTVTPGSGLLAASAERHSAPHACRSASAALGIVHRAEALCFPFDATGPPAPLE